MSGTATEKAEGRLANHILSTYNSMRLGMGLLAVATPVAIWAWGCFWGVPWQDSISAYYFAPIADSPTKFSTYPTRVLFGGILWAIGAFLIMYKGYSKAENRILNLAGCSAIMVAMNPMYAQKGYIPCSNYLHYSFAVLLFVCMAITAICFGKDTLPSIEDKKVRRRYSAFYTTFAHLMWVFIGLAIAVKLIWNNSGHWVFVLEALGIWAFGAYWLTKCHELRDTSAKRIAEIERQLKS